jgi:hypothetical protein
MGCVTTKPTRKSIRFSLDMISPSSCSQSPLRLRKPARLSMKRMILGASLVVVTASTAHALIGETESQLTKRYGDSLGDIPTEAFGSVRGFMATGYVVGIAIIDGVSSMEMFSKNNRSEMTPTEIEALLKANGPGDWISESISKPNWKRWRRVDGTLVGLYDAKRHFLYISSKSFYDAQGAKLEKQSHTE